MPISGARTMNFRVKGHSPLGPTLSASKRGSSRAAARRGHGGPGVSADQGVGEELVGRPSHQVIRSQTMAPEQARQDHVGRHQVEIDEAFADRLGHRGAEQ